MSLKQGDTAPFREESHTQKREGGRDGGGKLFNFGQTMARFFALLQTFVIAFVLLRQQHTVDFALRCKAVDIVPIAAHFVH